MPASSQNLKWWKEEEYLSILSVLLTYGMLCSRPEPKPTEGKVQRHLLPSLSLSYFLLLLIIAHSSKRNVLLQRRAAGHGSE